MAAVQQQDTLEDRLCDEEYKNWLKAALCLFRVKEGLESFVTQESDALHQTLLAISNPCGNCVQDDLENNRKLCSDCEKFKGEIKKNHKFPKPIWKNTNVQNWSQDHWSVARCFMNSGQPQHASAADADISALLNFIIHCKVFSNQGTYGDIQDHAEKVRDHRNDVFHRGKDELDKKDLDDWTKDMIQLLKNENPDGKLKSNAKAKEALTDIKEFTEKEIKHLEMHLNVLVHDIDDDEEDFEGFQQDEVLNEDFKITLKDENTVKIASLEAQMDEAKTLLQEHSEKLQKLQKDSTSQGQKVETLTKDVDTIQATIEKIQECLDNVRTHQTMTDEEVSKRISDMEDNFKSVRDDIEQLNYRLYKVETDVENLKSDRKEDKQDIENLKSDRKEDKKDIENLKSDRKEDKKDIENLKSDIKEIKKAGETLQSQNSETKTTDLSRIQKNMIASYKPHLKIQINLSHRSEQTFQDFEDVYTDIILKKEHEETREAERKIQNEETEEIKSFRQLFRKANVPIYRIALKGKAGLGKSTFLKLLLKTWCTYHNNRLNEVREGLPTDLKDGDVMLEFDILLFVSLRKISDEKNIIDVIYKQIPCLDRRHLPDNCLHDLMSKPDDNKVLMLMDGLDEMVVSAPYIEQIIKGVIYPFMTVIVASRPWKIDRLHQSEPPARIDLLIDMKGFSKKNSTLFAEKIVNCYKDVDETDIKQFWDDFSQNHYVKTFIQIPIFVLFLVQVWHLNKSFPQTVTQLCLKILNKIGKRYEEKTRDEREEKTRDKRKDAPITCPMEKLKMFPKLQDLSITKITGEEKLLAFCNIAYQFLIDGKQESPLKDDEVLDLLGNDGELTRQLALNIGFVSQDDCTEIDDDDRKVRFSFLPRIIQELLAAISLCCDEGNFTHFLYRLKTYRDVLEYETIITFIAGISSERCERIFEEIYKTRDQSVCESMCKYNRLKTVILRNLDMADDLCNLCMKCVREAEKSTRFSLKHLYIGSYEELNAIVPSIKNIQDIRSLTLRNIDFISDNCKDCFNIFECDNLECLVLISISLNDIDFKWLKSPGLLSLELYDVTMSSMSSKLLCDTLSQCTKLKKLHMRYVELVDAKMDLQDCSCLSELYLRRVTISSLNLSNCTNLEELTLIDVQQHDGKLDLHDYSCLSQLYLENVTISSLNLSKCTNLEELTLNGVKLHDGKLNLHDYSCLSQLDLENVSISSLNLSKCTNLEKLKLEAVELGDENLDLQDCSCLSELRLVIVTISSLNLSKCTNLEELTLYGVKLHDGKLDLHDYSCLSQLDLFNVSISNVSLNLSKCTKLKYVRLKDVKLCDDKLDLLGAYCLSELWLENETISSLNLSKCTNLEKLKLEAVELGDENLDLQDCSCLSELELVGVTISSLNLSHCTKLIWLTLKDVKVSDDKLDLSDASSLDHPSLEKVTISSLNLSKCTNLEKLKLEAVELGDENLDLQDCSCLSELELVGVTISSLNLSHCTKLIWLTLKDVKVSDDKLDLSDASSLDHPSLEKVTISSLNLSKCTNLTLLDLRYVKLGDNKLDLLGASCLSQLRLENVTISSLNLSKCAKLIRFTLNDVKLDDDQLTLPGGKCLDLSKSTNLEEQTLKDFKLHDGKLDFNWQSLDLNDIYVTE